MRVNLRYLTIHSPHSREKEHSGLIPSLIPRPPLAAFFTAMEKHAGFSMAAKKVARGGLGMRLSVYPSLELSLVQEPDWLCPGGGVDPGRLPPGHPSRPGHLCSHPSHRQRLGQ